MASRVGLDSEQYQQAPTVEEADPDHAEQPIHAHPGAAFLKRCAKKMNALIYTLPLIGWTSVVAAMMITILCFDRLRGTALKDFLSRFGSPDRRRVLHLKKQNGFYFFVDKLITWSDLVVRCSWVAALPALVGGAQAVLAAAFLISLCFLLRSACLTFLAAKRVKTFSIPLDYDGFGVYARTAEEWREIEKEMRVPLIFSTMASAGFLLGTALS